jgi:hypothetical protein
MCKPGTDNLQADPICSGTATLLANNLIATSTLASHSFWLRQGAKPEFDSSSTIWPHQSAFCAGIISYRKTFWCDTFEIKAQIVVERKVGEITNKVQVRLYFFVPLSQSPPSVRKILRIVPLPSTFRRRARCWEEFHVKQCNIFCSRTAMLTSLWWYVNRS